MGEIAFNTTNTSFRELAQKARSFATDGEINNKEEAELRKFAAASDGSVSTEEKEFIDSLTGSHSKERDNNINTLVLTKISDTEPTVLRFKSKDNISVSSQTKIYKIADSHYEKVNFEISGKDFTQLAKKAREFAADGKISEPEKAKLIEMASKKSGGMTDDEEQFIKSLSGNPSPKRDANINNLIRAKIKDGETFNLTLNITKANKPQERVTANLDNTDEPNPNKAEIVDAGANMELRMNNSPESLIRKISEVFKQNVPESFSKLINKFPDNTEALNFILALASSKLRTPEQKELIAGKIAEMSTTTNYDKKLGDTKKFVIGTLHDLALPQDISQAGLTSCVGTTIQINMSLTNPADYLKMLDTLAKGKNYIAQGGAVIEPNWSFIDDKKGRTAASGLAQNALMDYANGKDKNYDSKIKDPEGVSGPQEREALKGIFGGDYKFATGLEKMSEAIKKRVEEIEKGKFDGAEIDQSEQTIKNNLTQLLIDAKPSLTKPVPASIHYRAPGTTASAEHAVLVIDVKATDINDANGTVRYINPWGRAETLNLPAFKEMMFGAHIKQ